MLKKKPFIWKWSKVNDPGFAGYCHAGALVLASSSRHQHAVAVSCLRRMVAGHHTRSRASADRRVGRFIRMIFVPQFAARVFRFKKRRQFVALFGTLAATVSTRALFADESQLVEPVHHQTFDVQARAESRYCSNFSDSVLAAAGVGVSLNCTSWS